jgi:hypothetical protein
MLTKISWHDWTISGSPGSHPTLGDYGPWRDLDSTEQRPAARSDPDDGEFELTIAVE